MGYRSINGGNGGGQGYRGRRGSFQRNGYSQRRANPARRKSITNHTLFKAAMVIVLLPILLGPTLMASAAGIVAAGLLYFSRDLPSPKAITEREVFQNTRIYDRNGELLAELWDKDEGRRTLVPLNEISPELIVATLAIEDARFFQNPGVDMEALFRAVRQNYEGKETISGASTITMQLARNAFFDVDERYEKSYTRKMREVILAYKLSQEFSKEQILEMYLNEVYYGNLSYGVEAAAQSYFGKSAKEVNLAEAAYLAGLPQAPSAYDPFINPEMAKRRQEQVIDAMVYHQFITEEEGADLKKVPVRFVKQEFGVKAPHFVQYVRDLLESRYGHDALFHNGWQIYTTLDLQKQQLAERDAKEHIDKIRNLNAKNASVVAIDPKTGGILVMVGSLDFYDKSIDGQVNIAISERQPGSALKPFNYLTAFIEKGISPSTVINDTPTGFPDEMGRLYIPLNHDRSWHGMVSARRALASSLNMPAVIDLDFIGIPAFLNSLHRAGITSLNGDRYGLAVALGAGEVKLLDLTYAYSVLANGGVQVGEEVPLAERKPGQRELEPVAVTKIVDSKGNVVYQYEPKTKRIFPERETFLITSILSDKEARIPTYGPNNFLEIGRPAAAKTGTTEEYSDGWTFGYTPELVGGVWVGNANNEPMKGVMGVSGAGYIWHNFMIDALEDTPPSQFTVPEGVVRTSVWTTDLRRSHWTKREDWFLVENQPLEGNPGETGGWMLEVRRKPRTQLYTWDVGTEEAYVVARPVFGVYQPRQPLPPFPVPPDGTMPKPPNWSPEIMAALERPPSPLSMRIEPPLDEQAR
ncbi:MAG: transglycosylase domain-containing protein [Chloroflexi bacterium]|nr:transglycosylase domain-containing protein [Chloroflexota bacterium]MDA8187370.1 transglycosylase domain-containing protein [Dehalococcoidales bacterium]